MSRDNDFYGVVLQLEFSVTYLAANAQVFLVLVIEIIKVYINLQVPDSGNYTFYVSCDDWCELWKYMYYVDEFGMENQNKKTEESLTKKPIIALYAHTLHLQWNK